MEASLLPTQPGYLTSDAEQRVLSALELAGFTPGPDGWLYPGDPARALVRVTVFAEQYEIQRRRNLDVGWMHITTADAEEFCQSAFGSWRQTWPLSC